METSTKKKHTKRIVVHSLAEIPQFTSEDEERRWWAAHDLSDGLGKEVSTEQHGVHYVFLKTPLPPRVTEATEIRREKAIIKNSATLGAFRWPSVEEGFFCF